MTVISTPSVVVEADPGVVLGKLVFLVLYLERFESVPFSYLSI